MITSLGACELCLRGTGHIGTPVNTKAVSGAWARNTRHRSMHDEVELSRGRPSASGHTSTLSSTTVWELLIPRSTRVKSLDQHDREEDVPLGRS